MIDAWWLVLLIPLIPLSYNFGEYRIIVRLQRICKAKGVNHTELITAIHNSKVVITRREDL